MPVAMRALARGSYTSLPAIRLLPATGRVNSKGGTAFSGPLSLYRQMGSEGVFPPLSKVAAYFGRDVTTVGTLLGSRVRGLVSCCGQTKCFLDPE